MKILLKCISYALVTILIVILFALQINRYPSYGAWGLYHYYINSKYLKELGYFNLYSCTIKSAENTGVWNDSTLVRDLRNYNFIPVKKLPPCPINNFSKSRWDEFKKDNLSILRWQNSSYWKNVLTDKGFNPPPSWAAIAGVIANLDSLNSPVNFLIFNLDLLFIIIASIIVYLSAGKLASILTLVLSLTFFGTFGTLSNNFLQYGWYPCIVLAVYFWRVKKPVLAGIALGVGAGLQSFPAVFVIPIVLALTVSWIKHKTKELKFTSLFVFGFSVVLIISFLLGSIYSQRASIWSEWYQKISIHKEFLNGEIFDIGLPNLVGTVFTPDHSDSISYIDDYSHAESRISAFKNNLPFYYSIVAVGIFLILYVFVKYHVEEPMIYGFFLMYLFLSLSPYYYLVLSLIPFMFWRTAIPIKKVAIIGTIILFVAQSLLFLHVGAVSFIYNYQLVSELMIFIFLILLFITCVINSKKPSGL